MITKIRCRRLWVLQEIALAARNTCYWGDMQFPLSAALVVGSVLARHPFPFGHQTDGFHAAQTMNSYVTFRWRQARVLNWGLLDFTQGFEYFLATEPRDRVFAPVQLYRNWNNMVSLPPLLVSDYSKSVADVYRDATRYIFEHRGLGDGMKLDMIQHRSPEDLDSEISGFTTWTIRFDRAWDFYQDPMPSYRSFNAGFARDDKNITHGIMYPEYHSLPDPNIMILIVLMVDTVCTTLQPVTVEDTNDIALVKSVIESLWSWTNHPVVAEVLTAGGLKTNVVKFSDATQKSEAYHLFLQHIAMHHELPPRLWQLREDDSHETRQASWFRALFSEASRNRRFFRTKKG